MTRGSFHLLAKSSQALQCMIMPRDGLCRTRKTYDEPDVEICAGDQVHVGSLNILLLLPPAAFVAAAVAAVAAATAVLLLPAAVDCFPLSPMVLPVTAAAAPVAEAGGGADIATAGSWLLAAAARCCNNCSC